MSLGEIANTLSMTYNQVQDRAAKGGIKCKIKRGILKESNIEGTQEPESNTHYMGCILCGLRYVSNPHIPFPTGCDSCGSTVVILERNISEDTAQILRSHGQRGDASPLPRSPNQLGLS